MKIGILNAGTHEAQVSPLSGLKGRGEARTIVISIISFISNASFDFFFSVLQNEGLSLHLKL